ncbi:MAG: mechanosensitive ion channel family protein [Burkholderiaceae bacterium]
MHEQLPVWIQQWLGLIVPAGQVLLILLVAFVLKRLSRLVIDGLVTRYGLPRVFGFAARRLAGFVIFGAALLLILERLGVSGTVLWTAFTGFATVAAVAFFAAWSVLSNIFCSLLIFIMRPFRLLDHIELIEAGDKPGLRGQVIDVNLVYTTLEETDDEGRATVLQVPNNLFFQRATRRWRPGSVPSPRLPASATTEAFAPLAPGAMPPGP